MKEFIVQFFALMKAAWVQEVVKLMERAAGARAKAPLKESTDYPVCHSLNILVGVAEVRN